LIAPRSASQTNFKNEFDVDYQPSPIIWNDAGPQEYRNTEALAAFRDALALSVVPGKVASTLNRDSQEKLRYTNWFNIYPWMARRCRSSAAGQDIFRYRRRRTSSDAMAIWIAQFVGREIRLLDYVEAVVSRSIFYAAGLRRRGWKDAIIHLPHDGVRDQEIMVPAPQ
jgi:hypothetical protein